MGKGAGGDLRAQFRMTKEGKPEQRVPAPCHKDRILERAKKYLLFPTDTETVLENYLKLDFHEVLNECRI